MQSDRQCTGSAIDSRPVKNIFATAYNYYYIVRCKASWGEPEQFYKQLYVAMCVEIVKQ